MSKKVNKRRKITPLIIFIIISVIALTVFWKNERTLTKNSATGQNLEAGSGTRTLLRDLNGQNGIQVINYGTGKSDSKYNFTLKATEKSDIEFWNDTGYEYTITDKNRNSYNNIYRLAIMPEHTYSGHIGVWMHYVGKYEGKDVHIKCTYYWNKFTTGSNVEIKPIIVAIQNKTSGNIIFQFCTISYEVKYELFTDNNGTYEPISINMSASLADIDAAQYFGVKSNTGSIHSVQGSSDSTVYYTENSSTKSGYKWFYAPEGTYENTPNTIARMEFDQTSSFNIVYGSPYDNSYDVDGIFTRTFSDSQYISIQNNLEQSIESGAYAAGTGGVTGTNLSMAYFDGLSFNPYEVPVPTKNVSDTNEKSVTANTITTKESNNKFTYNIYQRVPLENQFSYTGDNGTEYNHNFYYDNFTITDTFPNCLNVSASGVKVYNDGDEDVTSLFNITVLGKTLTVKAKDTSVKSFYGVTYNVEVPVTFDVTKISSYKKEDNKYQFENTAKTSVSRVDSTVANEVKTSNTVTTTYYTVPLTITKKWEDNSDAAGVRPDKISVDIYEGTTKIQTEEVTGTGNTWTKTVELPKYKANGSAISYTIKESIYTNSTLYNQTLSGTTLTNTIKKYPYTVNYYEKGTTTSVSPSKTGANQNYGTKITAESEKIDLKSQGYNYDSASTNELTITNGNNILNLYYTKRNDLKYTVQYLDKDTGNAIKEAKTVENQTFKSEITSSSEVIDEIDEYRYDSAEKAKITIEVDETKNIIKLYYVKKDAEGVKVHHYIVGTTTKVPSNSGGVVEDETLPESGTVRVGDDYTTQNAESRIAPNYRVATNKEVYGDSLPTELVGKEDENYVPSNASGTYTESLQTVTYYYTLVTPTHTNSISKTGTKNISKEDDTVSYTIKYTAEVQNYIGNATITIVDTLPYAINTSKSNLNGGTYDSNNKKITWTETVNNIDTYTDSESGKITISKNISVVYSTYDYSKTSMKNTVSGNALLTTTNTTTDSVQDTATTNYTFYKDVKVTKVWDDSNKNRLQNIILVLTGNGQEYTHTLSSTNANATDANKWEYTFKELPKYDSSGNEITYTLSEREAQTGDLNKYVSAINGNTATNTLIIKDTSITKTGTNEIASVDDKIDYTVEYTASLDDSYTGNVKVTIVDNLPYEIDTTKEYNLNGGTYNANDKTITWTQTLSKPISITKNVSLVYKNVDISKTKITNNVTGSIELDNGYKENKTAKWDTNVNFTNEIIANKVWKGDSNTVSSRPTKVTVELNSVGANGALTKVREAELNSGNNWEVTWSDLDKYDSTTGEPINYTVTENNVPTGYYSNITKNGNKFTVTNSKYGSITITKVDSADNTIKLGGAEFKLEKLKDVNGSLKVDETFVARTATSSTTQATLGQVEFKDLEYGTYRLTETKAPTGYNLLRTTTDIEINETTVNYVGELSNTKKTILPSTGGIGRIFLTISGIFILVILIMIKKKRIYVVKV